MYAVAIFFLYLSNVKNKLIQFEQKTSFYYNKANKIIFASNRFRELQQEIELCFRHFTQFKINRLHAFLNWLHIVLFFFYSKISFE